MLDVEEAALIDGPPPDIRYRRNLSLRQAVTELWQARSLVWTLGERELRARYKQAGLGFAWAVLTPLALMLVFSVFFNRVADIDTGDVPYALFSYVGLLPWSFFSGAVNLGGLSLVLNNALVNKVYCPREVFPLAGTGVAGMQTALSLPALAVLMLIYGFAPQATTVWAIFPLIVLIMFTVGLTTLLSGIIVYIRDVRHMLPVVLQLGLFASPVAYGIDAIPEGALRWYAALNPLVGVIEGLRLTVLYGEPPAWDLLGLGALTSTALLVGGYKVFKRMETGFADVA
jgi:ABC-2 type transport system permease protein/lipopolysaccharide transport system permease protein